MKRLLASLFVALSALVMSQSQATAQMAFPGGGPCGGTCFRLFPGMHSHGPLFNYGPYAGYYPFAPYGPWTSDLQYTGPGLNNASCGPLCGGGRGNCGAGGCGAGGCGNGFGGLGNGCGAGGCGTTGFGAGQVFHGGGLGLKNLFSGFRTERGCDPCSAAESPLGFFSKVFKRCHPGCEKASCDTGCSAAPPCPATTDCGTVKTSEVAKPCGGCSASAQAPAILERVSGFGGGEVSLPGQYRRER